MSIFMFFTYNQVSTHGKISSPTLIGNNFFKKHPPSSIEMFLMSPPWALQLLMIPREIQWVWFLSILHLLIACLIFSSIFFLCAGNCYVPHLINFLTKILTLCYISFKYFFFCFCCIRNKTLPLEVKPPFFSLIPISTFPPKGNWQLVCILSFHVVISII